MHENSSSLVTTRYLGLPGERFIAGAVAIDGAYQVRHELEQSLRAKRSDIASRLWRLRARARRVGFAAGRRAREREIDVIVEQGRRYTDVILAARNDCLDLSVAIAAEIVEADLVPNSHLLARRVEAAVRTLLDARAPRIRVAPAEVESLRALLTAASPESIVGDPTLSCGDAIVETAAGQVRIVWREQLERIRGRLIEHIRALRCNETGGNSTDVTP